MKKNITVKLIGLLITSVATFSFANPMNSTITLCQNVTVNPNSIAHVSLSQLGPGGLNYAPAYQVNCQVTANNDKVTVYIRPLLFPGHVNSICLQNGTCSNQLTLAEGPNTIVMNGVQRINGAIDFDNLDQTNTITINSCTATANPN